MLLCTLLLVYSFSRPSFTFFFYSSASPPDLHSFPTRRSSDLHRLAGRAPVHGRAFSVGETPLEHLDEDELLPPVIRSEEHTSELQSHSDLVCRLLLEKKK